MPVNVFVISLIHIAGEAFSFSIFIVNGLSSLLVLIEVFIIWWNQCKKNGSHKLHTDMVFGVHFLIDQKYLGLFTVCTHT